MTYFTDDAEFMVRSYMSANGKKDKKALSAGAAGVVRAAVPDGGKIGPEDVGSLSRLVAVAAGAGGDPKEALRSLSDEVVDSMFLKLDQMSKNPLVGGVVKLISLEWCFRHGFLKEDWIWTPDEDGGKASYRSDIPMDDMLRPLAAFAPGSPGSAGSS
jgi:hypothetical protein